jgi:hypothetical protein
LISKIKRKKAWEDKTGTMTEVMEEATVVAKTRDIITTEVDMGRATTTTITITTTITTIAIRTTITITIKAQ